MTRLTGATVVLLFLVLAAVGSVLTQQLSLPEQGIFFEQPRALVSARAWFPEARSGGGIMSVVYQEVIPAGDEGGELYLSALTSDRGTEWSESTRIVGPLQYESSNPPVVFSSEVTEAGEIYIAYQADATQTVVLRSSDKGASFTEVARLSTEVASVAPTLSISDEGGLLLFLNQNVEGLQRILYAHAPDGESWSRIRPLAAEVEVGLHFLPSHTSFQGREYVVFQSLNPEEATTYQLYSKYSDDGGRTWSRARLISDFAGSGESDDYLDYDNQRPLLRNIGGTLALVWERSVGAQSPRAYYAELDREGTIAGEARPVSGANTAALAPEVVSYNGRTYVLYFTDPTAGSRIVLATETGRGWVRNELSAPGENATFASPLVNQGRLHVVWQTEPGAPGDNQLVYLEPDQSVESPSVEPVNFVRGRRSSQTVARYSWTPPADASGVMGYNYVWSQDPQEDVPRRVTLSSARSQIQLEAEEDGPWYFRIVARDRAGNWSDPETVRFYRDTTAPPPVTFAPPAVDEDGYLVSNSFSLDWRSPDAEDIAGYSTALNRVGPVASATPEEFQPGGLPTSIVTESPTISRDNLDDGLWALSVAPVDEVGNIGPANTMFIRLNKYVPSTRIFRMAVSRDLLGRYAMDIIGRGFTANGTIDRIILDPDGQRPYEHVFSLQGNDYRVVDNRTIRDLTIDDIGTGEYRVGLNHTERGLTFADRSLRFEATGTITFGDYTVRHVPQYQRRIPGLFTVAAGDVLLWVVMAMLVLAIGFSTTRVTALAREGQLLRLEARALVRNERLPLEEKERQVTEMRRRGIGLRVKFTFFAVLLVASVAAALAFFLSRTALERQETILARGLEQRIELLLDSVSSRSEELLIQPQNNRIELSNLVEQREVMDEALYITITGQGRGTEEYGYVWATNDPVLTGEGPPEPDALDRGLDTENLVAGESRLRDPVTEEIAQLRERLNSEARSALGDLPTRIEEINNEIRTLIVEEGLSERNPQITRLDNTRVELNSRILEILDDLGSEFRSFPQFDTEEVSAAQPRYVFYQPAMAWDPASSAESQQYYRGTIRIGISIDLILEEIATAQRELIISTVIVALVAIGAGVVGALLLATIVVIPINRLVQGVEVIRDTEDKEQLRDHSINVRTRDELSLLADTVNSMTQGLVQAAVANKDLIVGKEVQKMFIPLVQDSQGNKLTTAQLDIPQVEFSGYYEGAKGVSGDYFTYTRLDDTHYAIMKCDVSGKGVPAALIMVEVATIFTNHFKEWSAKRDGSELPNLVAQINDLLESLSFKGRFAAFTMGILDVKTGRMSVCNAGDNQIHIYDADQGRVVQRTLPEAPAAGVFPSDLIPQGFPQVSVALEHEDILLLFTDGVEEAKRVLRDAGFRRYSVTEEDVESGRVPADLQAGMEDEEFSIARIHDIVRTVRGHGQFRLTKALNPVEDEELLFDFSTCDDSAESVVMALVAVEKIFRMYPDPKAGPDDRVQVDKKVDDFLKEHFRQYRDYFHHPLEEDPASAYRYYSHVREDDQYDDLTILGVRRK